MKKCPSCGQETKDDSQEFCTRCGSYFVVRPAGAPTFTQSLSGDPIGRGMAAMDVGNFAEGIRTWDDAIRSGTRVDPIMYARMVDSAAGCMLGTVLQPQAYDAAAVPQLASAMPDREFVSDLMAKLAGSLEVCSIQNGVLGLANSYMYLYLDSFAVYTDLRDLRRVCETACEDIGAMVAKASVLQDAIMAKGPSPLEWLASYQDFTAEVRDAVAGMVDSTSQEEMDRLAEHWANARSIDYIGQIKGAFGLNSQAVMAGSITARMLVKSRDTQIRTFEKKYLKG